MSKNLPKRPIDTFGYKTFFDTLPSYAVILDAESLDVIDANQAAVQKFKISDISHLTPDIIWNKESPYSVREIKSLIDRSIPGVAEKLIWKRACSKDRYEWLSATVICVEMCGNAIVLLIGNENMSVQEKVAKLTRLAFFDQLTNLPNRNSLVDTIQEKLMLRKYHKTSLSLLLLDIDNFRTINQRFGSKIGNLILQETARRLKRVLGDESVLGRFRGDQFLIIFNNMDMESRDILVQSALQAVQEKYQIKERELSITFSAGIAAETSIDLIDSEQFIRRAEQALSNAKRFGRGQIFSYDSEKAFEEYLKGEKRIALKDAIIQGSLSLHYQPQFNFETEQIFGFEALIRWQTSHENLLLPSEFLDLLKGDEDLNLDIIKWVITNALADFSQQYSLQDDIMLSINVNIPNDPERRSKLIKHLARALSKYPAKLAKHLIVEIVETTSIDDLSQAAETTKALKQLGVRVALDDFGTGFSSLSYLKYLNFDFLKIDRIFISEMEKDKSALTIVKAIIGMAKSFNASVIAEGVERAEQVKLLRELGCPIIQGYFLSRPMVLGEASKWKPSEAFLKDTLS